MHLVEHSGSPGSSPWSDLHARTAGGESSPAAPALLAPERPELSYGQLHDVVRSAASALAARGLKPGDPVAIVLPNGPEMATCFLAVSAVAAAAPLNPAYTVDEFSFFLRDLGARALIALPQTVPAAVEAAGALGIEVIPLLAGGPETPAGTFGLGGAAFPPSPIAWAGADDLALLLHTSGTTSRPKLVPLTHRNLRCSARSIADSLELTPADRCLNVMPLFHVHGLVGAMLASLAAGGSVVCAPGLDAARFGPWLERFQPTWYTAVPTMHMAILGQVTRSAGPPAHRLRMVRSCSAALPRQVMAELETAFGVPVIEAYGMTEASHQMASNPLPPRPRKPGSVGLATGLDLAIMDDAGNILPPASPGEVVVRGAGVTCGYQGNPVANESAFTAGWFRTGDLGQIDTDGYLHLTGRLKEVVNRGGEKISPREIDDSLLEHPAICQAVAFAVPHPSLGEDLVAAVTLREGMAAGEGELRQFLLDRLPAFKVPSRVLVVSEIPKGPTGKVQRLGLANRLAGELAVGFEEPVTEAERWVVNAFEEVLRRERIGRNDNFFLLGGDSLRAMQVSTRLSKAAGVTVTAVGMFEHPTPRGLAATIEQAIEAVDIAGLAAEMEKLSPGEIERLLG